MRSTIRILLADFERAICRDRCHAIMAAPRARDKAALLDALEALLSDSLPVLRLSARGVPPERIAEVLLERLGDGPGLDPEGRLQVRLDELARRDSALVLLLDGAESIPRETLRVLGRFALRSDRGLRLAVFVAAQGGTDADAIAATVAALGVGAQKIQLGPVSEPVESASRDDSAVATPALPSLREAMEASEEPRAGWPSRVLATAAALALMLVGAHLGLERGAAPDPMPEVAAGATVAPATPLRPIAAVDPAPPPPIAAVDPLPKPEEPAAVVEEEEPPATPEVRRVEEAPTEVAVRPPAAQEPAPAPTPPSVRVSLNAHPWAIVEVDGRKVGITPLADVAMTAGPHRFRVHLADGRVIERTLRVDRFRNHLSFP